MTAEGQGLFRWTSAVASLVVKLSVWPAWSRGRDLPRERSEDAGSFVARSCRQKYYYMKVNSEDLFDKAKVTLHFLNTTHSQYRSECPLNIMKIFSSSLNRRNLIAFLAVTAVAGVVALINFLPGVGSLQARDKGFKEQLAAKYPDLKLITEKVADGQAVTGLNIMTDLITAYPKLRGVFSDALYIGQGAGQAVSVRIYLNQP